MTTWSTIPATTLLWGGQVVIPPVVSLTIGQPLGLLLILTHAA